MKTYMWDPAQDIENEADAIAYLRAVLAESNGNAAVIQAAIGDVARAIGMTEVARKAGVTRASLYKSLAPTGNPSFATINAVITALGGSLDIVDAREKELLGA